MAVKVDSFTNILHVDCPRCHRKSMFTLIGAQQPTKSGLTLLLACGYNNCGHILIFRGILE